MIETELCKAPSSSKPASHPCSPQQSACQGNQHLHPSPSSPLGPGSRDFPEVTHCPEHPPISQPSSNLRAQGSEHE